MVVHQEPVSGAVQGVADTAVASGGQVQASTSQTVQRVSPHFNKRLVEYYHNTYNF